jgi:hypothetical protein
MGLVDVFVLSLQCNSSEAGHDHSNLENLDLGTTQCIIIPYFVVTSSLFMTTDKPSIKIISAHIGP